MSDIIGLPEDYQVCKLWHRYQQVVNEGFKVDDGFWMIPVSSYLWKWLHCQKHARWWMLEDENASRYDAFEEETRDNENNIGL